MSSAAAVTGVVLTLDGVGVVGTIGFFVPAAIIVLLVAGAVVRDRRSSAVDEDADTAV